VKPFVVFVFTPNRCCFDLDELGGQRAARWLELLRCCQAFLEFRIEETHRTATADRNTSHEKKELDQDEATKSTTENNIGD
jgi:hypothetical protein